MINIKDGDYTNRVSAADDHTLASDGRVPFNDTNYRLPYVYDERSHEILLSSSFDGAFNFIAGAFMYENNLLWDLVRSDMTRPYRFGTADEQARAASPIFGFLPVTSCQDALIGIVVDSFGTNDPPRRRIGATFGGIARKVRNIPRPFASTPAPPRKPRPPSPPARTSSATDGRFLADCATRPTRSSSLSSRAAVSPSCPSAACRSVSTFSREAITTPRTWDQTIGHISLEYRTPANQLVYGRVSTGYRSGAFNQPIPGVEHPYIEEETLVNYEAGMKGLFLETRMQVAAGFWLQDF